GVIEALRGLVVRRRRPLDEGDAAFAGDFGGGLDQGTANALAPFLGDDEEVVHQHALAGLGRAEVPVEAGVADELSVATRTEQQPVRARAEEAAEEAAVALVVDLLGFVEALV